MKWKEGTDRATQHLQHYGKDFDGVSTTAALPGGFEGTAEDSLNCPDRVGDVTQSSGSVVFSSSCCSSRILGVASKPAISFSTGVSDILYVSGLFHMCLIKGLRRVLPLRFSNVSSQHTLSHTQSGHSRRIERKSKVSQSRPRTNRPTRPKQVDNLNMPNHLVRFYDPEVRAKDPKGRTVDSILAWDDDRLETAHDYIQILFPLPEYSPYNSWAPAVDRTTFNAFRQRKALRDNLTRSFERMLDFYGFTLEKYGGKVEVCQSPGFPEASQTWLAAHALTYPIWTFTSHRT